MTRAEQFDFEAIAHYQTTNDRQFEALIYEIEHLYLDERRPLCNRFFED